MRRVYDIIVSILGESKQGGFDSNTFQYQFNCPNCADEKGYVDGKYNLEVSFSLGKYHCWSCGISGNISKLILKYGNRGLCDEYFRIVSEIRESRYYNIDMFGGDTSIFSEDGLKLPKTFEKIRLATTRDRKLYEYLKKRKITQDIIDLYNIGVTKWDGEDVAWRNRIIFPSYNAGGDLNYYIGRTYKDTDKRVKYRNCLADKSQIVLHEDKIQWNADIYLVEGAIDCIYYPNSIALMGKFLKKDMALYNKLYDKANARIVICLDGDTEISETKRIYSLLNHGRLYGKIGYIRLGTDELPWKDFGEVFEAEGKLGIAKVMRAEREFNEIELLV